MKIDEFMKFRPCYTEDQVLAIAGDKEDWDALDILRLDIPAKDRLWAVLRSEFIDDRTLRLFAVWCARQCNQTHPICIAAIDVAERYANGEAINDELVIARNAAGVAVECTLESFARKVGRYAAMETTRKFAKFAARYASECAALSVSEYDSRYAAESAAWGVARDAAMEAQVAHLIEMLEEERN